MAQKPRAYVAPSPLQPRGRGSLRKAMKGRKPLPVAFPPAEWADGSGPWDSWHGIHRAQVVLHSQIENDLTNGAISELALLALGDLSLLQVQMGDEQRFEAVRVISAATDVLALVAELFSPTGSLGFHVRLERPGQRGRPAKMSMSKQRKLRDATATVAALMAQGTQKSAAVDLVAKEMKVNKAKLMSLAPPSPRKRRGNVAG